MADSPLRIRTATSEDRDAVTDLHSRSRSDYYRGVASDAELADLAAAERRRDSGHGICGRPNTRSSWPSGTACCWASPRSVPAASPIPTRVSAARCTCTSIPEASARASAPGCTPPASERGRRPRSSRPGSGCRTSTRGRRPSTAHRGGGPTVTTGRTPPASSAIAWRSPACAEPDTTHHRPRRTRRRPRRRHGDAEPDARPPARPVTPAGAPGRENGDDEQSSPAGSTSSD